MNARSCCLLFAAGLMTVSLPACAQIQNGNSTAGQSQYSQPQANSQQPIRGHREAQKMVAATASFTDRIDSQKAQPGAMVNAKLTKGVVLDDGAKLPSGTILVGEVVTDNTHPGNATLALRFTEARLKEGKTIPIKATIVGIYPSPSANGAYWAGGGSVPPGWNDGTLQIDQIGALPGIDLHSKIASENSGVFVSTKKNDIKVSPEYSMTLALAANQSGTAALNSPGENSHTNLSRNQTAAAYPQP